MNINFTQGIIIYPYSGTSQLFLSASAGYVSLGTTAGRVDVAFAFGEQNYLLTEASSVPNAWGPYTNGVDTWLYWDINTQTAVRTFGTTILPPLYGPTFPVSPAEDQHFFHTTEKIMYVYQSGGWREAIRVFAAMVNTSTFTPLGVGFPATPFAGTQVGITGSNVVGRIIVDNTGTPIRKSDGSFFTSEDEFFINGSPANTLRFEANVINATAQENIATYQVVAYTGFNEINLATYNQLQTTAIAMSVQGLGIGQVGTIVTQGTVVNPAWNWTVAGAPLWVDDSGELTAIDLHTTDVVGHPIAKPPIGRVLSPTSVFFDQGLGGAGPAGPIGPDGTPALATDTVFGITKLSLPATSAINPIAVGDNDPRMVDARAPLTHEQPATTITFTPYGTLTGPYTQNAIQQLEDEKLSLDGGTLTGFLTLAANPVNPLHAATKLYVDSLTLASLTDVTLLGPASLGDVLSYDGAVWTNTIPSFIPKTFLQLTDAPSSYVGQAGLFARVNIGETGLEFAASAGTPAGANTEIQYNNSGSFGADSSFTYDLTSGAFRVSPGTVAGSVSNTFIEGAQGTGSSETGGAIIIEGGQGGTISGVGGYVEITGGDGVGGTDEGGYISIAGGDGNRTDNSQGGGRIDISSGDSIDDGHGGDLTLLSGTALGSTGSGGDIYITSGNGNTNDGMGAGGIIYIETGIGYDTQYDGYVDLILTRGLRLNNLPGTVGQILQSNGVDSPPTWAVAGITNTSTSASTGVTYIIDPSQGVFFDLILDANVTFSFAAVPPAPNVSEVVIRVTQDGTGNWTITWPGSVVWISGQNPNYGRVAGSSTLFKLTSYDGGTTWVARKLVDTTPRIISIGSVSGAQTLDWSNADVIRATVTGATTFTNTNAIDGQRCLLEVSQDGVGSHTVSFTAEVRFGTDITSYIASTGATELDRIGMFYHLSSTTYDVVAVARGF